MKRSGSADLALMGGSIPSWLFDRMTKLSLPIVESIILEYGTQGFLQRLSDGCNSKLRSLFLEYLGNKSKFLAPIGNSQLYHVITSVF